MRINVGCGQNPTRGWRNFDNSLSLRLSRLPIVSDVLFRVGFIDEPQYRFIQFARLHEIEFADATARLPIGDGAADALYSCHMFEHLDREEAALFLREVKRVLRPGGVLRLVVPDIKKHVQQYHTHGDADAFIASTLLAQPRPRTPIDRLKALFVGTRHHQWMYDGASLSRLLEAHGFISTRVVGAGVSRIDDPYLDLCEREDESVYVEALRP